MRGICGAGIVRNCCERAAAVGAGLGFQKGLARGVYRLKDLDAVGHVARVGGWLLPSPPSCGPVRLGWSAASPVVNCGQLWPVWRRCSAQWAAARTVGVASFGWLNWRWIALACWGACSWRTRTVSAQEAR